MDIPQSIQAISEAEILQAGLFHEDADEEWDFDVVARGYFNTSS